MIHYFEQHHLDVRDGWHSPVDALKLSGFGCEDVPVHREQLRAAVVLRHAQLRPNPIVVRVETIVLAILQLKLTAFLLIDVSLTG